MKWKGQQMKKRDRDRQGIWSLSASFVSVCAFRIIFTECTRNITPMLSVLKLLLNEWWWKTFSTIEEKLTSRSHKWESICLGCSLQMHTISPKSRWQNKPGKVVLTTNNFSNGWTVTNHSSSYPLRPQWIIRACNKVWKSIIPGSWIAKD